MATSNDKKDQGSTGTPPSESEALREQLASTQSELAELKQQMQEFMLRNAPVVEEKKEKPKMLDKKKPYATHRQIGGVWYEQDGVKFDAKGFPVKEQKKGK